MTLGVGTVCLVEPLPPKRVETQMTALISILDEKRKADWRARLPPALSPSDATRVRSVEARHDSRRAIDGNPSRI